MIGHSVDIDIVQGNTSGFTLSHSLLQRLLERYPFGHVFSYDELGAVFQSHLGTDALERSHPSHADLERMEAAQPRPSEAEDADELFHATKGARSIAFTTLWDYRNDKWFAASISEYDRNPLSHTRH